MGSAVCGVRAGFVVWILIVLVAGVPVRPLWVGVILTIHVPAFFSRIVQVAVRFFVFLSVAIRQVPLTVRVVPVWMRRLVLEAAVMVYVVSGAAGKLLVIGWFVVRVPVFQ